jgi:hypothetical protein
MESGKTDMSQKSSASDTVKNWLAACTRHGKISRNTIGVGLVVLDKMKQKVPVNERDLFSPGGELKGSRSGLPSLLANYGIPTKFLKEATTRQAHQDARILVEGLDFGKGLAKESPDQREKELTKAIAILIAEANKWLSKQPIKVSCDRHSSPLEWIGSILEKAKGRSGGVVEQHLIGAKLQKRHPQVRVPNLPSHAGDKQTGRSGDFELHSVSYHVTATEGKEAVSRCKENIESGTHPVLLVPKRFLEKTTWHAESAGIADRVTILSIEDFITQNVIEMSTELGKDFFGVLEQIVNEYNTRLEEVETDMSLKIELL